MDEQLFAGKDLKDKRIAILACSGFEQSELLQPLEALQQAGARVDIISPEKDEIRGWNHQEWGRSVPVDRTIDEARAGDYDALVLPGGVMNPDHLRQDRRAVSFVRRFFDDGKPIAAICHGPWTLVEADVVRDMQMTSWPSLRTDLTNAGARWTDQTVVIDRGLVTSRNPGDLPAFNRAMIQVFKQGVEAGQGRRTLVGGSTR